MATFDGQFVDAASNVGVEVILEKRIECCEIVLPSRTALADAVWMREKVGRLGMVVAENCTEQFWTGR